MNGYTNMSEIIEQEDYVVEFLMQLLNSEFIMLVSSFLRFFNIE